MLPDDPHDVRSLRRRWKPSKETLGDDPAHQPLLIRMHRACSWMQRVEESDASALDERLVFQWVALNALYGEWDTVRREPISDAKSLPAFFDRLFQMDADGHLAEMLVAQRQRVMRIFEDPHLSSFFWEAPSTGRARQTLWTRHQAKTWYIEQRWRLILERVVERIYLLRCQLVHGAATCGGNLNRDALRECCAMLDEIMHAVMLTVIDHGASQSWETLCYPPNPVRESRPE